MNRSNNCMWVPQQFCLSYTSYFFAKIECRSTKSLKNTMSSTSSMSATIEKKPFIPKDLFIDSFDLIDRLDSIEKVSWTYKLTQDNFETIIYKMHTAALSFMIDTLKFDYDPTVDYLSKIYYGDLVVAERFMHVLHYYHLIDLNNLVINASFIKMLLETGQTHVIKHFFMAFFDTPSWMQKIGRITLHKNSFAFLFSNVYFSFTAFSNDENYEYVRNNTKVFKQIIYQETLDYIEDIRPGYLRNMALLSIPKKAVSLKIKTSYYDLDIITSNADL